jgi:hypothetical protein
MSEPRYWRRIEVYEPWWNFTPGVWTALDRLGYELVPARHQPNAPDARIMSADRLRRLRIDPTVPVILLGEPESPVEEDPRVIGVVGPPAELPDLFGLLQTALEVHPRAAPRTPASLIARFLRKGVDSQGTIICVSEMGCRLRTEMPLPGSGSLHLQFRLPGLGLVHTVADLRHEAGNELGLSFGRLSEASRAAIAQFVTRSLMKGSRWRARAV